MPRHTHPRGRGGHSRAHIRAARERAITRRLKRLADERLVHELSNQRDLRVSWRDPSSPPAPPLSKEQAAPILHECRRSSYGAYGRIPHLNGLSRRLFTDEGHVVDMWDCGCGKCVRAETPRTRRKRQDAEEADRQLSDAPERWPKAAPARPRRCRHRRRRLEVVRAVWPAPGDPEALLQSVCVDCRVPLPWAGVRELTGVQADVERAIASPSPPLRRLIALHGWPAALAHWRGPSPGWAPWSNRDQLAAIAYAREILPRRPTGGS